MRKRKFAVGAECKKMLEEAVYKRLPVTITTKNTAQIPGDPDGDSGNHAPPQTNSETWQVYKSCFLSLNSNRVILAQPLAGDYDYALEPAAGTELAVTFKKGYSKCLFITRLIGPAQYRLEPEAEVPHTLLASGLSSESVATQTHIIPALAVYHPQQIEKMQRRGYNRTTPPPELTVPVDFWVRQASEKKYRGVLANLSAGGIGIIISPEDIPEIRENKEYEMHFNPLPAGWQDRTDRSRTGQQGELVASASEVLQFPVTFRHVTVRPDGKNLLGFQTVGLELTEHGRGILHRLSRIVKIYQLHHPLNYQSERNS